MDSPSYSPTPLDQSSAAFLMKELVSAKNESGLLMVNCWFGAPWFGILRVPLSNTPFHNKGIPNIQTTNPNQQNKCPP